MTERETSELPRDYENAAKNPDEASERTVRPELKEGREDRAALSASIEGPKEADIDQELEAAVGGDKKERKHDGHKESSGEKTTVFGKIKHGLQKFWTWLKGVFKGKNHSALDAVKISEKSEEEFLKEVLEQRPHYRTWMQEAGHGKSGELQIPEEIFLATAKIESRFDEDVRNPKSSATGLFQFIDSTWAGTPYAHLDRRDPKTSIQAVAWFIRENVKDAKLNPDSPEFAKHLYLVHHEGVEGFQRMQAFQAGKLHEMPKVPKSYRDKTVMDVEITDYKSYVTAMNRLAERFALLVKRYRVVLTDLDKPAIT